MAKNKDQKIEKVLLRGVEKIFPNSQSLEEILKSGKKIRLYSGIDPTGPLHLGHLAVLKKLRQFQDLGHEVIILIGDFTATIGDPSGKLSARKPLSRQEVLENAKNYKKQIGRILDLQKSNTKFLYNEEWINKLKPVDLLKIFSHFNVARLLERDMFQERIKAGKNILLHEFIYPVFQAYDSLVMGVDLEVGGNDQTFNMLMGRDLMKKIKNKEKLVMTLKLLTDPTGKKMGKTEGNLIALKDSPKEMFGKIMAWPDSLIGLGFELLTDISLKEIKSVLKSPREAKAELAKEIVSLCHDKNSAKIAEKEFTKVFKEKKLPTRIPRVKLSKKRLSLLDLLIKINLSPSRSQSKRLVLQGGVKIDGKICQDWQEIVQIEKGMIVQVGKRNFTKII